MSNGELDKKLDDVQSKINTYFSELVEKEDVLEYFSKIVCPPLAGHSDVKKAILLQLATDTDIVLRDRLHILLVGLPGTGKTFLTDWVIDNFGAFYIDPNTTRVGLTADASGNVVTGGMLNKAHHGILICDELDMLKDRDALREAMERGWYHIVKGKHDLSLDAEVRIIGSINEEKRLSPALKDRFDFVFEFKMPTATESRDISEKLLTIYFKEKKDNNVKELKEYLCWIKDFEPKLSDEKLEEAKRLFTKYFEVKQIGQSGRWIATCIRIAKAIAKFNKRDIKREDFISALTLKDESLNNAFLIHNVD